eukprot:1339400-Rhodomonas_salina.1
MKSSQVPKSDVIVVAAPGMWTEPGVCAASIYEDIRDELTPIENAATLLKAALSVSILNPMKRDCCTFPAEQPDRPFAAAPI